MTRSIINELNQRNRKKETKECLYFTGVLAVIGVIFVLLGAFE